MKRIAVFSLIGAAALAQAAAAQSDAEIRAELEELCLIVHCRRPAPVSLKLPDGKSFEMTPISSTPIVTGDLITVYSGETVWIEASIKAGRLVDLTAVPKISQPERTLMFQLKQEPAIGDGTNMILKIKSPFAGVLKYRLGMMLPTGDNLFKTSACPLPSGITVMEHWPHPIFQIVATDFQFVDPESEAARTCE
jgi:hypothetical protein